MEGSSLTDWISVSIAALALALSIFATVNTVRSNKHQAAVNDSQDQVNKRLLKKDHLEQELSLKADLDANFEQIGNSHKLNIFNKGRCSARNVTLTLADEEDGIIIPSELKEKFPLEMLDPHASVKLHVLVHFGTKGRHKLILHWDDDYETGREAVLIRDIF